MEEKEIIVKKRLEERFGNSFSISMKEIYDFIEDQIDDGIKLSEMRVFIYKLYRDDNINIQSLKKLIEYLGGKLVPQMEYYGEKAKEIINTYRSKVANEEELMKRLFHEYQAKTFNLDMLRLCVTLMGYYFNEEFENMTEEERLTSAWVYDINGDVKKVNKDLRKFIDTCIGIINLDNTGFLIPSYHYINNYDFIADYIAQNDIPNSKLKEAGLFRKYKGELRQRGFKRKIDVFRMIITLDLSSNIAKQFMAICGYSFSPFIEEDMFMLDYLNGKYPKVKNYKEFAKIYNEKFVKKDNDTFFEWPNWE